MKRDLQELLDHIDPSALDYQEWINVGMALKEEGCPCDMWDAWSSRDAARYHSGECRRKWDGFGGSASPVTGGTIFELACRFGFKPSRDEAFDWGDEIGRDDYRIIDGVEPEELVIPSEWSPKKQIMTYLETLFDADDIVGYVTDCWRNDEGKSQPKKGCYDRTAGQLIDELSRLKDDDIGAVFGDYDPKVGAWIRFNPLDGNGVKNSNVTEFRYALVESDTVDIAAQNTFIRELQLPVAALVYSGGKSVHAIVRIDAADAAEYRRRVEYLFNICKKNDFTVDEQNKNPSRLSRMPGVMRNGRKQYLLDTNIGKKSWDEWKEWVESVNDDLPEFENLSDVFSDLPELAPPLIDGILRQGHKMLIAGPSKAGKSFALIELAIAIAEGKRWLGYDCAQGKVLYVNLELDRASCLHRFADVYKAKKLKPEHIRNIDIWHLRGKSVPINKLVSPLIRRAKRQSCIAVIIDPIYKVLTGDENSAEQMARFCNEFDRICAELGTAVIYCHHHSKGDQGTKKSMDRASGSGVFARDPDALLDLIELDLDENKHRFLEEKAESEIYAEFIKRFYPSDWDSIFSVDDAQSASVMRDKASRYLEQNARRAADNEIRQRVKAIKTISAWRMESTLREFPKPEPLNCFFEYPVHKTDGADILKDVDTVNSNNSPYQRNFNKKKSNEERQKERTDSIMTAFEYCNSDGITTVKDLAEYSGVSEKTVRRHLKEHGGFWVDGSEVGLKNRDNIE